VGFDGYCDAISIARQVGICIDEAILQPGGFCLRGSATGVLLRGPSLIVIRDTAPG